MLVADQTVEPYDGRVADQLDRRINDRRPHLRASHQHLIYRKASGQSQFRPEVACSAQRAGRAKLSNP
jgi:hypothetical protein